MRSIFRNPFRSGVSLLASLIATSLIFTTFAQVDSLEYLMNFEFDKISHQDYTITVRDPQGLSVVNELGSLPGVVMTERQLGVGCDFTRGSLKKRLGIIGVPKGAVLHTPLDKNGEPIVIPEKGLVLSKKLAEILEVEVGERLTMRPLIARRTEVETTVMGISENYFGLTAYADMDYLSGLLGEARVSNVVLCSMDEGAEARDFIRELKRRSRVVGIGERGRLFTQMHETFGQMMGTMMVIMIFFAGLIAFGSVLNAAMVSVSERQREIGSLRVLGYTNRQVAAIFSGESLLLNFVGIFLGLYAGIGQMYLVARAYDTELYRFPAVIEFSSLCYSALWMVFFAGLAQLIVYRIICKLEWLDVLKVKE
ncbi:MAG: FtsX-like permease family protein [Planctomycetes bacterium]|nr:FtsX-like permease family protein [Planctomycetota bacterium]